MLNMYNPIITSKIPTIKGKYQYLTVFLIVLKNVVEYATNFTGAKNINSICKVLEELLSV